MSKVSSPNSEALEKAARVVKTRRRFLVATHRNPDGDALGSALALGLGLERLGKSVTIYNADPVPYSLRFLPGAGRVTSHLSSRERFDASFVVDCSELGRVGEVFLSARKNLGTVILLDHHARGKRGGDIRVVDKKAASSGVVVHRLLSRLKVKISTAIATNLYVTLVADTGGFRYANTTSSVLSLASDLIQAGAVPDRINRALHESEPLPRLKLLAQALKRIELHADGRIGVVTVTQGMLRKAGATLEMADDFVDYPRSLASVEVAVLLRESPQGWRVSLRSKKRVDVGRMAALLGGGGHVRAAGFTKKGDRAAVLHAVLRALRHSL